MKTISTPPVNPSKLSVHLILAAALILLNTLSLHAQNLVTNSAFTGGSFTGWSTSSSYEVNPQSVYGGPSSSIYATEIDNERTVNQQVCILPGLSYTFTYQAARRPDPSTPKNPGITVKVTGVTSNTSYVSNTQVYTNTTWSATSKTFTFAIPANATDKKVNISFVPYNNTTTYGVVLWDIEMAPAATNPISINGPTTSGVLTLNNFSMNNVPSGVSYSWAFSSDANQSTSASAAPFGITWASLGAKNASVTISNSTCPMASYSQAVTISAILATQWSSFTGAIEGSDAHLTWVSGQESNGKYFVIERSTDGVKFDSAGVVASRNSNTAATYQFIDKSIPSGNAYYRVRHVDLDNAVSYSKIIALDNKTINTNDVHIFPNPAVSVLNYDITSAQDNKVFVQIFSPSGVLMSTSQAQLSNGVNHNSINIGGLNKGNYFLKIVNAQGSLLHAQTFMKI